MQLDYSVRGSLFMQIRTGLAQEVYHHGRHDVSDTDDITCRPCSQSRGCDSLPSCAQFWYLSSALEQVQVRRRIANSPGHEPHENFFCWGRG